MGETGTNEAVPAWSEGTLLCWQGDMLFVCNRRHNKYDFYNSTAAEMAKRIDGIASVRSLCEALVTIYDVASAAVKSDVQLLLDHMVARGYIQMMHTPRAADQASHINAPGDAVRLVGASVLLTRRCNLECDYCYARKDPCERDLGTDEWLPLLDELVSEGLRVVTLSGGEPTIHAGFAEVLQYAAKRCVVQLNTNGMVIDEAMSRIIADCDIRSVWLSIDSTTAQVHDAHRGQGSWNAAMRALQCLVRHGVHVVISAAIHAGNVNELDRLEGFAMEHGAELFPDALLWDGDARDLPEETFVDAARVSKYRNVFASRSDALGRFVYGCQAEQGFATITAEGMLTPCDRHEHDWPQSYRPLLRQRAKTVVGHYEESSAFQIAREANRWARTHSMKTADVPTGGYRCVACKVEEFCSSCPSACEELVRRGGDGE